MKRAFTLLELLLTIAIIAALSGIVLFSLRPAQILQDATRSKQESNANDVEKAIKAYILENGGNFPFSTESLAAEYYDICQQGETTDCINLDSLIPAYLPILPIDSTHSTAETTGYKLKYDPDGLKIDIFTYEDWLDLGETSSGGLVGVSVNIDDASDFGNINDYGRYVVRASNGTLYAVLNDGGSCEVWRSVDGTVWTEQDSANNPACNSGGEVAVAIDSTNTLHIAYTVYTATPNPPYGYVDNNDLFWVTFSTTTNTFSASEEIGVDNEYILTQLDINVDTNNIPHIALQHGAGSGRYLQYINRVGGSWGSGIFIENLPYNVFGISMSINEDNIPEISYIAFTGFSDADLTIALGNQNNATSFSLHDADTTVNPTNGQTGSSVAIDSNGNTWVAYVDLTTNYITLVKHNDSDGWATWQSPVTNSNVGYEPSIAINGLDIYIFYQDENSDIAMDMYNGSSWSGETILETGTLQDVRTKWSFLNNNQGSSQIDFVFSNGTDVYWNAYSFSL